jgi:putative ABC transport system substrate-binding protein
MLEEPLRVGLRRHGYLEGKNLIIEWRRSLETEQEFRTHAADLARAKADVIVAIGSPAAQAALNATTVPVVFLAGDPVAAGFAASLARPGGNATGLSVLSADLYPKRLELLHQLAPRAPRIGYLMNSSNPSKQLRPEMRQAAHALGVELVTLDARNPAELETAIRAIHRGAADAILVSADLLFLSNKAKIADAVRTTNSQRYFLCESSMPMGS